MSAGSFAHGGCERTASRNRATAGETAEQECPNVSGESSTITVLYGADGV